MSSPVKATITAECVLSLTGSYQPYVPEQGPSYASGGQPAEAAFCEDVTVADVGLDVITQPSRWEDDPFAEAGRRWVPARSETLSIFGDEAKAVERIESKREAGWTKLDLARIAYRAAREHICATILAMGALEQEAQDALTGAAEEDEGPQS